MSKNTIRLLLPLLILLLALVGLFFLLRPDPSASAGEAQEHTFEIADNRGSMNPEEISVEEGYRVNLRMTADEPLEFHVHGYDLEEEVESGQPAELSFGATTTGRFKIENHLTDFDLGALVVQPR